MITLGLETSGISGGAALVRAGRLLARCEGRSTLSHSSRLMHAVQAVLEQAELNLDDLDGIAVSRGPGSFTGVRIGVTTAKMLAWALDRPVLGIDSLQVIASNLTGRDGVALVARDARKSEVYAALYGLAAPVPRRLAGPIHAAPEELHRLWRDRPDAAPDWLIGDGLKRYASQLSGVCPEGSRAVSTDLWEPRAAQVALLGQRLDPGELPPEATDAIRLAPLYVRRSEAELKRQRGELFRPSSPA